MINPYQVLMKEAYGRDFPETRIVVDLQDDYVAVLVDTKDPLHPLAIAVAADQKECVWNWIDYKAAYNLKDLLNEFLPEEFKK